MIHHAWRGIVFFKMKHTERQAGRLLHEPEAYPTKRTIPREMPRLIGLPMWHNLKGCLSVGR